MIKYAVTINFLTFFCDGLGLKCLPKTLCGMLGDQLMVLFGKEHGTFKKWSPEQLGWLDGGVEGRRGEGEEGLGKGDCHQA